MSDDRNDYAALFEPSAPPGQGLVTYCAEEVDRQGYHKGTIDHAERTAWMLESWVWAARKGGGFMGLPPTVEDVKWLGSRVERGKNCRGFRDCGVRVGSKVCPPWKEVRPMLDRLVPQFARLEPLDFYRRFLEIHPFRDGNGRVGKVLLNWRNGTLREDPIFPPNDFWGIPIRNP